MKVFISWSGELSRQVALAFRDWLPAVIQSIEPYVSSEDIDKGARWSTDIAGELEKSIYGILCITKENVGAPWINFEAGALSKSVERSRVSPFLFDVKRSEVKEGPLLQFQSTIYEKEDIRKLVNSLNSSNNPPLLDQNLLDQVFDVWWPKLEEKFETIELSSSENTKSSTGSTKKEEKNDILEKVLEILIQQNRIINSPHNILPPSYLSEVLSEFDIIPQNHPAIREMDELWFDFRSKFNDVPEGEMIPASLIREYIKLFDRPLSYVLGRRLRRRRPMFRSPPGSDD